MKATLQTASASERAEVGCALRFAYAHGGTSLKLPRPFLPVAILSDGQQNNKERVGSVTT